MIARVTARFVLAHPVLPKHDVIAAGDQDTHAGKRKRQLRRFGRAKFVVARHDVVGGAPIVNAGGGARVQEDQTRAAVVQQVVPHTACGRIPTRIPQRSAKAVLYWTVKCAFGELPT